MLQDYAHQFKNKIKFCSDAPPSYLMDLLSLRLVGLVGARVNVWSSTNNDGPQRPGFEPR